ncbi:cytochrome P450 [Favolaschia claudopus]|uniref:Cytochrome P450 n=1 Tax=Favolaschia claudopus TaxID=2862362 RepID=A0AAW0AU70_9AGAR
MGYYIVLVLTISVVLWLLYWRQRNSIRGPSNVESIPGPPSPSWIFGNLLQFLLPKQYGDYEYTWSTTYGPVYTVKAYFGHSLLVLADLDALKHIFNSPDKFVFGPTFDMVVRSVFGKRSVIARQGKDHQRLRAGLKPGFTAAAVQSYQPIFERVARGISEKLESLEDPESPSITMDISLLLSSAAFDAISEVVLGCSTSHLDPEFVKTNLDFTYLTSTRFPSFILADAILGSLTPWLRRVIVNNLPTKNLKLLHAQRSLADEAGRRAVHEKRELLEKGLTDENSDVFTSLVNSVRSGGPLSYEDIYGQTSLLMLAGGVSTANTLAFGLAELARNIDLQEKPRAEIHDTLSTATTNRTDRIAYDSLPLLNAFIKESLRFFPAAPILERVAAADTVIPLSREITLTNGQRTKQIMIRKGQVVVVGVASFQRVEAIWGQDANTFRPSRWLDGSVRPTEAIGPFANLLTFSGGARSCLGWRFTLLEMQVMLCELLSKYSLTLPAGHSRRICFAGTLQPLDENGDKSLVLCMKRIL